MPIRRIAVLVGCVGFLAFVALAAAILRTVRPAAAQPDAAQGQSEVAALHEQIEAMRGKLPDQSHAMKDVGYHFTNLWFAGQKKNCPLAKFYLEETRSHLRWAVRIIPVRKTAAGPLELQRILDAVDSTYLNNIDEAIDARDAMKFQTSYKQTIEGCYACHKAAEKPYLRPQVPQQLEAQVVNFDPHAKWPQ